MWWAPKPALPSLLQISIPAFYMLVSFLYHCTNIFNLSRIHEYPSKGKLQWGQWREFAEVLWVVGGRGGALTRLRMLCIGMNGATAPWGWDRGTSTVVAADCAFIFSTRNSFSSKEAGRKHSRGILSSLYLSYAVFCMWMSGVQKVKHIIRALKNIPNGSLCWIRYSS